MIDYASVAMEINNVASDADAITYYRISERIKALKSSEKHEDNQIIDVIADACSMLLSPTRSDAPYKPCIIWGERRSMLPEDLTVTHIESILKLLPRLTNSMVIARLYDILWMVVRPRKIEYAIQAINHIMQFAFQEGIDDDDLKAFERALRLAISLRSAASNQFDAILTQAAEYISTANQEKSHSVLRIFRILCELVPTHQVTQAAMSFCQDTGKRLFEENSTLQSRHFLEEVALWYQKQHRYDDLSDALSLIGECFIRDAKNHPADSSLVENHFYEAAVRTFRKIPRRHRAKHNIDAKINELLIKIRETGEDSLHEMACIKSDPIDISDIVKSSIESVSGKNHIEALLNFSLLHGSPDPDKKREEAIDIVRRHPLSRLFSSAHYSSDGRVIARNVGLDFGSTDSEPDVMPEIIRDYSTEIGLAVTGQILPALDVIRNEHAFTEREFILMALHSPFIPNDRARIFGRGLYLGFWGDFMSSIYMLCPQVEHLVRFHLRGRGCQTSKIDEAGIENEVGLSTLLVNEEINEIFGKNLAFELRLLFTEHQGPNLRNQCAHGLLSSDESESIPIVYAWWLTLKIVFNTYYSANHDES